MPEPEDEDIDLMDDISEESDNQSIYYYRSHNEPVEPPKPIDPYAKCML